MSMVSDRIANMTESATLAMAAKARELKEKGIEVISLSLGEPDFKTPKHIQDGAIEAIKSEKYFAYPPVNGYLDLRQAISKKFKEENGLDYSAEQIVVSNGAKQSITNIFQSIINPGDEVIIFAPYWVSYSAMVELAGGVCKFITGTIDTDFKATGAQLKDAITDKTKAVIFSSPCNPTGSVFRKEELEDIAAALTDRPEIVFIADEIYELINYTGSHISIGTLPGMLERTVTVNGMAKGYAMTGWRVGYIGAPLWLAKACNKIQGQFTSANASISQRAAYTALTSPLDESIKMSQEYLRRRDLVYSLLSDISDWKVNMPEGAFYFFPNVEACFGKSHAGGTINTANDLCLYLLEDARVSIVEGGAFGAPECVRLSYAASEEDLRTAIERIKVSLAKLS